MKKNNFSIGVDIENISKFNQIKKNDKILSRIFTNNELKYCFSKRDPAPYLAVRYAGKEAVVKAVNSTGVSQMSFLDYKKIEIYNEKSGTPRVKLVGLNLDNLVINISLSHCDDKAIAFVIIKKYEKD